jgi:hypothetical protein
MGPIDLDPCANADNTIGARRFYTAADDGLTQSWGTGLVFVNPPFTNRVIQQWVAKVQVEHHEGAEIITLTPFDATRWRRELAMYADARCTPWRRVNYVDPDSGKQVSGVRFPSELHYFGPRVRTFCDVFDEFGECLRIGSWSAAARPRRLAL